MKRIYTHENNAIVQNAKNYLENNGIQTIIKNEFASGGAGDLAPTETWPALCLLNESDTEKATELLQVLVDTMQNADWVCKQCDESNGAMFEYCWNCQSPTPAHE